MSIFKGAYEKQTIHTYRVQMKKPFFNEDTFLIIIVVVGCLIRFIGFLYDLRTLDTPPYL